MSQNRSKLSNKLPDAFPILSRGDLCLHETQQSNEAGKYTLDSWFNLTLPEEDYTEACRNEFFATVMYQAGLAFGYYGFAPPFISLDDQAAIWNRAVRSLGYEVPAHACVILTEKK